MPHASTPSAGGTGTALLAQLVGETRLDTLLDLLEAQVEAIDRFAGYNVLLLDSGSSHFRFERMRLPPGYEQLAKTYLHTRIAINKDEMAGRALGEQVTYYVDQNDFPRLSADLRTRLELMKATAIAALPLLGRTGALGVLTVYKQDGDISRASLAALEESLKLLSAQLQIGLRMKEVERQEQELRLAVQKQEEFLSFINAVNDLTEAREIYDAIARGFIERFGFELVGFALREADELVVQRLVLGDARYASRHHALERFYAQNRYALDMTGGGMAIAFQQNAPLLFPDIQALLNVPMLPKDREAIDLMETARTFLLTPIRRKGKPVGVMWMVSLDHTVTLSEQDQVLVEQLSSFVGTAIGNAQMYDLVAKQNAAIEQLNATLQQQVDQLAVEANTDKLTGLANYSFFEAEMTRRANEYSRDNSGSQLSVIVIDVDHFKRFNDTHGHPAGNLALQEIARRIRSVSRKMDIPCRYGGEEFVVILPRCDADGAYRFAERVRGEVAGTPLFMDGQYLSLTISAGCATYRPREDVAAFLDRADKALYRAKHAGRNRVERAA